MEMLYGLLNGYRSYLLNNKGLSSTTAKTYNNHLCRLLDDQCPIISFKSFDINKILNKFKTIKHKNQFSQAKNALLYFFEYKKMDVLTIRNDIENIEKQARKKYKNKKAINYNQIKNTIDHIKNQKLRLSYQTMLSTGLRIFELCQIKKDNVNISKNQIFLSFVGKGGTKDVTIINKSEYPTLYKNLTQYLLIIDEKQNMFYSAGYLQNQAKKHGFECHDLRRMFAKKQYDKTKSKKVVMKKLRHKNLKTTDIYLSNNIKF